MSTHKHTPLSPTAKAAARSRSPPLIPLPSLSTTVPGLTAFDRAVHVVNISNMTSLSPTGTGDSDKVSFSPEDQLLLYGAYKQATKGDVKGLKPTFFDIAARSKWQAWANMRGKSHQEAQEIYVDLVVKSLTRSGGHPDLHQLADEILQRPPSPRSSLSRPGSPNASPNLDKDLPPIQSDAPSAPYTTPSSITPASSTSSHSPHQHHAQRKGSISHSIRSVTTGGMRSAAASVYELAPETLADSDMESTVTAATNSGSNQQSDSGYHEITETVVEEEILNDDDYAAEVQMSRSASLDNAAAVLGESKAVEDAADAAEHDREDEDDEDEVYQSSEEYESDGESINSDSATSVASSSGKLTPSSQHEVLEQRRDHRSDSKDKDDLVDEGVFEEEEKDELKAEEEGLLGSPPTLDAELPPAADVLAGYQNQDDGSEYITTDKPRISRDGSVSSGYGGSVLSDRAAVSIPDIRDIALTAKDEIFSRTENTASPLVEPYRVHALHGAAIASPETQDLHLNRAETDGTALKAAPRVQSVGKAEATSTNSLDGLVCPVSKKTAASGEVCPAAMFAQARAAAEAEKSSQSVDNGSRNTSTTSAVDDANAEPSHSTSAKHQRAMTEPAFTATSAQETASPPQSSSSQSASTSAVTAATNQGKRIGQGIVSRFSALRNSLAAASARAASSALSGSPLGSSSVSNTDNPNAVVVKDPVTNQSVTVVCPHLTTTHVLETEVVRLQTDISVLHERLDLLQESLKVKSQTRAQERRSARGIIKLVLRQGLINAILLLIVFAVLYKRKSPIAFAILAYIGEGRKEGEAGWRALMRWGADMIRVGQRNQQYVLRAGRRNGYW